MTWQLWVVALALVNAAAFGGLYVVLRCCERRGRRR